MRKLVLILLCIVLMTNSVSASILDDIFDKIVPHKTSTVPIKSSITPLTNDFKAFYDKEIESLNTKANIALMSSEFERQNIEVLRVYVPEYRQNFYIVKDVGTKYDVGFSKPTHKVELTVREIRRIKQILSDGKVTFFERVEIWSMVK